MIKLLLLGSTGLVGSRVAELLKDQFEIIAPPSEQLDVTDSEQVKIGVENFRPDAVLYAAGFTNVDLAEEKPLECQLLNVKAAEFFVKETNKLNIPFYYLSTDYVFSGTQDDRPYNEQDSPNPVDSVYAKSKRDGELVVLNANSKNGVIRLIMPFSAVYKLKFDIARLVLEKLKKGEKLSGIYDQKVNPIFVDNLVFGIGKILEKKSFGIYHLAATSFTTPFDFMLEIARVFNLPQDFIEKTSFAEFSKVRKAKRPQNTWLDSSKFRQEFGEGILQSVNDEIRIFKEQIDSKGGFG